MPQPLRPLIAAVTSSMLHKRQAAAVHAPPQRFITLSREAGAGGRTLMNALVERLRAIDPADPPWTGYDRQLLDQVAQQLGIDRRRIDQLESDEPNWLLEVFERIGSSNEPYPTDAQVYRTVVHTIRRLAREGRAVIVGRGAAQATSDLPGGLHIRLVAPLQSRVANLAQQQPQPMSPAHAAAEVHRLDKARQRFYQRFWHIDQLGGEHFDLTLNTARLDEHRLIEAILAAMPARNLTPTPMTA